MKRILQIIALLALGALLYFAWVTFFPGDEKKIRRLLDDLSETTSFGPDQGRLSHAAEISDLMGLFTHDVEIYVDVPGEGSRTFSGRDEIREAAIIVRGALPRGLTVELLDPVIAVATDKQSATVEATAKITLSGEREFHVQELKLQLKKVDGAWRVSRAETVRTLGG